jgi:SAM-dependent methyltransferase
LPESNIKLLPTLKNWWQRNAKQNGLITALVQLMAIIWEFMRDSLPNQKRQRYGDVGYDWEHRVDTTSATVDWRTRLLGLLNSPYQPIPAEEFREAMSKLVIDFSQFTFIDVGSGKARALMLAGEYGFKRIVGIELLPQLHRIAEQNVQKLRERGVSLNIELICADASQFNFPDEPTVLFLFNPLRQDLLSALLNNLESERRARLWPLYIVYANPIHEDLLAARCWLEKIAEGERFSLFAAMNA